jgi:hypothetical protein
LSSADKLAPNPPAEPCRIEDALPELPFALPPLPAFALLPDEHPIAVATRSAATLALMIHERRRLRRGSRRNHCADLLAGSNTLRCRLRRCAPAFSTICAARSKSP